MNLTKGQLARHKSHQKQTRVKGAWRIANAEREHLANYNPEEHGKSYDKFRWAVQANYQEKRRLLQAGEVIDL